MGKLYAGMVLSVALIVVVGSTLVGCDTDPKAAATKMGDQMARESEQTSALQQKMIASVPVPNLKTSAERQAVARRAKTWNNEDKISYVYLLDSGRVMAFYVARGKVSSLNSYLNNESQIVRQWMGSSQGSTIQVLPSPDIDGTYGHNVEGIFFFTDTGAYVEWNGKYICSDQPLKISQEPLLLRDVK